MATSGQAGSDGRQSRWLRHNEERRRAIIEAAIALIEAGEPGVEVHVQQIAEQAGLKRSVVYRHFSDRADLDRAVQGALLDDLWAQLLPAVRLDGTIPEIVERIVGTYVAWVVAHPALHRFLEQNPSTDDNPMLDQGIARISDRVVELITTAVDTLGLQLDDDERAAIDPLVFGLVGAVFGAVRRWVTRGERVPPAPRLVALVTESVWFLLEGHARVLGLVLDRDQPVEELLSAGAAGTAG